MILVVADTSPLNYLVQIGCVDVLPGLYDRIMIPTEVKAELAHARTPPVVEAWLRGNPKWLEVCECRVYNPPSWAGWMPARRRQFNWPDKNMPTCY